MSEHHIIFSSVRKVTVEKFDKVFCRVHESWPSTRLDITGRVE
jgi:hypothetical protein